MKRTILLMIILLAHFSQAQNPCYDDLWSKVEQFEIKGLPTSALKIVESIKKQAIKDKNSPQLIKTMLFKSKYALVLEEDAQLKIINDFKKQIELSTFPTKNVLESVLANLYWQYFQQNRWKFYNRTKTSEKVDNKDFRTWDLQTLFDEIHLHYQKSLANGLLLQLEPLEKFNVLLNEQKNSKIYRPTLFDFLNHTALEFYKTNETHITKPAYKFEINDPDFLADPESFSILRIESKDSMSLQLNALKIYQNLIQFHLKDESFLALADVNIKRLQFVNRHASFNDKQNILLKALKSEKERLKTHEVSALYNFEIASVYYNQSKQYQPTTKEEYRWKVKEAIDICNQVIAKFPKSKGAEKCNILKVQIEQQTLQITTEEFLPIQQDARLLVEYKNIETLQFNIHKLSEKQFKKFNKIYQREEQRTFISGLYAQKSWSTPLRNEKDYQTHTTEVLLPKLNNGRYLIVATTNMNDSSTFAFSKIQVTNMALVETDTEDYKVFQVINRNNGAPIANTSVKLTCTNRNNQNNISKNYTTNTLGEIRLEKTNEWYRNINLEVKTNADKAYFGDFYLNRFYSDTEETVNYKSFLFTDRSIYRPGQTVYFKGIAIQTEKAKSKIVANEKVYAVLYNINNEEIKELELITNEFGSVSGEFILPNSGLNGQYRIEFDAESGDKDLFSEHYFSVEEYKRPKFKSKFNPITNTYKINDSITLKGNAIAYAGSNISYAKVIYRVHRKVEYPEWYFWYRPWSNSNPQEITHGQSITNDKGEFEITFKAIPDQNIDKNSLPIFHYEVTADVTDLNGETRSTTTIVNVGYHALSAKMSINERIDKTKKKHFITVDTKNLNGEFVPAKGTIKIYKLKSPERVLRTRPWPAPDYQDISEKDFKTLFPHDTHSDKNPEGRGKLILEKPFNTETSKNIKLGKIKKWKSGTYLITLESKDKFDQLVKDEIKTTVFSDADKVPSDNKLFTISTDKPSYTIGNVAKLTLGSSAENITVTLSIEKNKRIVKTETIVLKGNKQVINIPVQPNDLGGFAIHYSYAAFNSYQSGTLNISVPYPKTNLNIETLTFRDKLQPGTDETWQFKIKGPQGEKVSAELLASMYDASLDQFKSHQWSFNPVQTFIYSSQSRNAAHQSFGTQKFRVYNKHSRLSYPHQYYDQWNWFGFNFGRQDIMIRGYSSIPRTQSDRVAGVPIMEMDREVEESVVLNVEDDLDEVVVIGYGTMKKKELTGSAVTVTEDAINSQEKLEFDNIKIRENLKETAFFFPNLKTDNEGNVSFSFTTPEALTQWKLQLLAHTKTLESATLNLTTVTQKELMVIPNAPRFLREGDQITISTKIANLTDKQLSGDAILLLSDAISGNTIDTNLGNSENNKTFSIDAKGNTQVSWSLSIPEDVQAVQYKIIAKSGEYSDGEQNALPVLSNRMLVTETLPMWIKSDETKTFTLDKLKNNSSTTLKHHKLTLEMTSNPAWYAVQALPYLIEYPHECNEQTFSRYYANALASHIANSNPRIQEVFNQWKSQDALVSNLEKNEELKSILIQETPWLRDAESETEQKRRMALLFDLNKMNNELQSAINKLKNNQMSSGAWSWFKGGRENRYITQHIITGFGHLKRLNVVSDQNSKMTENAIKYLDSKFIKEYKDIRKYNKDVDLNKDHLSYTQLHYLYMRSFFTEVKKSKEVEGIIKYYQTQIQTYWLSRSLYSKGLMALISHRNKDSKTASKIIKSLKETSITSEELGMYWKANANSWYWYQAPIETQALLIEAFGEIENDTETIDNLKIWLLKNKQTNRWKTTKATTEAVYALLLQGSDWLSINDMVEVFLGGQKIEPKKLENIKVEAGTGYYKTSWNISEIKPEMGEVKLTKKGNGIAWGSLYWQYFEDLDNITSAKTPLSLKKKLFLKRNTDTGEEISEITSGTNLRVGDLVRVRIELKSDRNMEFIHMKDMRASGLEPVNVLSKYKWQDGLGYYESTKDASTNFFFDYLPKGVYVFEYDLRINNAGNMSNGITTIQSMYAPEFSSHSEGIRIKVQ
ncbi:alpha-2-macroglobulin [uncultured Algibacter sp.]|uniref:alpha-2-macroglobulin family protein n=1 Tax=uncultured Algibacter sp. TaxID=298659 RepID=UPI0026297FF5|nr:MG2 domain-containing protein [uncultured Algibacter sp.]